MSSNKNNFKSIEVQSAILDYIRSQTCTRAEKERRVTKGGIYVTIMGLNYLVYEETKRSNLAKEGENYRSNTTREKENFRSNVVGEVEVARHNRNTENLGWGSLKEQSRTNQAREAETQRSNVAGETIKGKELEERQYQFNVSGLSEPMQSTHGMDRLNSNAVNTTSETFFQTLDYIKSFIPLVPGKSRK